VSRTWAIGPQHNLDRWRAAWSGLFVALLAIALAIALVDPQAPQGAALPAAASAALLFLWYAIGEVAAHRRLTQSRYWALYFLAGWLLWFIAVRISPSFFILLSVLFPHVFLFLPLRWAVLLAVLLNGLVLVTLHRIDSDLTATWMLILSGTSLGGGLLAIFINGIIQKSEERRRLIADLEATRATLAQAEFDAGILHERQRLAGELHDTIIQGLIAVITNLEAAESTRDPAASAQHIANARAIARADLSEARRFIWMAETEAIDTLRLVKNLRSAVESWSQSAAVPATFRVIGDEEARTVPHQLAHALLRILHEAQANIARHASATQVNVTLSLMPGIVLLDINDNGRGFMPSTVAGSGFGLGNMRRRVEALGGQFTMESEPGSGTTIAVEFPSP
jgi:signal transduction histidine kinase